MKKKSKKITVAIVLLVICSVISIFLLFGTFYLHGVATLFIHIQSVRIAFILFILLGLIAPIAIIWRFSKNVKKGKIEPPKLRWKVIIIIVLILPISMFAVGSLSSFVRYGNKEPVLLLSESTGTHGISNMGVSFWTESPTTNDLEWGIMGDSVGDTIEESDSAKEHCFMLRDLLPDTTYWYRINDGDTYNFTTPNIAESLNFACAGDLHFGKSSIRKDKVTGMLENILGDDTDLFFGLGDWVNSGFLDSQWNSFFSTCSPYLTRIPTGSLIGNHDAMFNGYKMYEDYFSPQGLDIENGTDLWKHVKMGNAHFFLLHLEWGIESFSDEQESWLIDELNAVPDDEWKIVMSHAPFYASGGDYLFHSQEENIEGNVESLVPIFEDQGVDMVLSGHIHRMEAMEKNGIFYGIAGSFGSNAWEMDVSEPGENTLWIQDDTFGYMDITLEGNNGTVTFVDDAHNELFAYNITSL